MANKPPGVLADQHFEDAERLFRRVRKDNIKSNGKASFLAFELPDMSVNRERNGTAEEARRGFDPVDWAVVAFTVEDVPANFPVKHDVQVYLIRPRHIPVPGNFPHSKVRVWRVLNGNEVLITERTLQEFEPNDPDIGDERGSVDALLDPDLHMRWRKRIELLTAAQFAQPLLL